MYLLLYSTICAIWFMIGYYWCHYFKNSENTEGILDAQHKSGVLHGVRESRASGENCESDLASGELPLKKITDYGNICPKCNHDSLITLTKGTWCFRLHCDYRSANMKES